MFRFGFADPAAGQHAEPAAAQAEPEQGAADAATDPIGAEEVLASEGKPTGAQETVPVSRELSLFKGIVSNSQAASLLSDDRVAENDLIAGVYEGGFKTWEGGLDLAEYMAVGLKPQQQQQQQQTQQQQAQQAQQEPSKEQQQQQEEGKPSPEAQQASAEEQLAPELTAGCRVMELGCGHGLPGLAALWAGAEVHFQDYNRSVITTLTIPNVASNASAWATRQQAVAAASSSSSSGGGSSGDASSRARFYAGSWDALPALLCEQGLQHSYDLVLTAETIYSLEAMRSLYRCIKACLRPDSGVAYVAAKSYYFGVGGGTAAFRKLVEADGCFECEVVTVIDDGLSNKREILKMAPRQQQEEQEQQA